LALCLRGLCPSNEAIRTSCTFIRHLDCGGRYRNLGWNIYAEHAGRRAQAPLELKQDGAKLTGSGGPNESERFPRREGKAEDGALIFEVQAGPATMRFALKQDGEEITGDVTRSRAGLTQTAKLAVRRK